MWTAPRMVAVGLLAAFGMFWVWYGGQGRPLSAQESTRKIVTSQTRFKSK